MKILALEFSSEQRSVAVLRMEHASGVAPVFVSTDRSGPRATNAFHLIEAALAKAGIEREEIDRLAVGLGPGSYTGIRAAISIAQAWQLARNVRLLGISSIECLAFQAQNEGIRGRIHFAIDAQRNEFYLATYQIDPEEHRLIEPLRIVSSAEVLERIKAGEPLAGPEIARSFPQARLLFPDAGALARLAMARSDFVRGEELAPIYLRETNFVKAPPPRILPT